jgi:hypothetical protein
VNRRKLLSVGLGLILIGIFISGCSPSPEEQQATSAALTAAAAPRPTSTPLPTRTATPTPAPTPTPTPDPDPMTMIDLNELDLPDSFIVDSPDVWGIERGAVALGTGKSTFMIENSFVFADDSRFELIFGYTAQLSGSSQITEVDEILADFIDWFEGAYDSSGVTITKIETIPGADQIGDKSAGIRVDYIAGSNTIVLEQVMFRIGDILAKTNVENFQESSSSQNVIDIAEVYASNINYPVSSCEITHIRPILDQPWPAFDYHAAGFYPREHIIVWLESEIAQTGQSILIGQMDGLGDEAAVVRVVFDEIMETDFDIFGYRMETLAVDNTGRIAGTIIQTNLEGQDIVMPDKYLVSIYGLYSGCVVSKEIIWEALNGE